MSNPLNENDYVTFARRFVKETVETMDYKELQSLVTDYIHEDLQKSYDDIGQIAAFENMSSWNCDVFDEIAEDYPIVLEDTEGWTEEDFADYRKETFIDINNTPSCSKVLFNSVLATHNVSLSKFV